MKLNSIKLLSPLFVLLFLTLGTNAQVIEELEDVEEDMPAFIDMTVEEGKPVAETWPRTKDTVRFKRGYKYGFVFNKSEILIPFDYSELPPRFSDLMVAEKDGLKGVINSKNEIVVPFEYKRITHYAACFSVFKGTKRAGLSGILDLNGNVILPVKYFGTSPYLGKLEFNGKRPAYIAGKERRKGKLFFDEKGKLMKEVPYKQYRYLSEEYIWVIDEEYKHGILTPDDKVVLECKYGHVFWAKGAIACVSDQKGMYLINIKDETVYHNAFNYYKDLDANDNIIVYNFEGKKRHHGLMNIKGKTLVEPSNQNIFLVKDTEIYGIMKEGKLVDLVDIKGESIPGYETYPKKIIGIQKGFYTKQYESDAFQWSVFKPDGTKLNDELYSNPSIFSPTSSYPTHLDVKSLLGVFTLDKQRYYLFMDGSKVVVE